MEPAICPAFYVSEVGKNVFNFKKSLYRKRFTVYFGYWLSTKWAVPSGQKTFSPMLTFAKRRLHSVNCLSHPSQSRDNIFFISPLYDKCHKLLIRVTKHVSPFDHNFVH